MMKRLHTTLMATAAVLVLPMLSAFASPGGKPVSAVPS